MIAVLIAMIINAPRMVAQKMDSKVSNAAFIKRIVLKRC